MQRSTTSDARIALTIGATAATGVLTIRDPHATSRRKSSATKIWMSTVTGATIRATDTCGIPPAFPTAGLLIATVIGIGFLPGDGRGLTTPPGATRPSTTDAGLSLADAGAGSPDLSP